MFRKQLSQQKKQAGGALQAKNNHGNKALARENIEKLKHAGNESNISIIRPDPPAVSKVIVKKTLNWIVLFLGKIGKWWWSLYMPQFNNRLIDYQTAFNHGNNLILYVRFSFLATYFWYLWLPYVMRVITGQNDGYCTCSFGVNCVITLYHINVRLISFWPSTPNPKLFIQHLILSIFYSRRLKVFNLMTRVIVFFNNCSQRNYINT